MEKEEHRDDTQDQGTAWHATGRGMILGQNPEQELWTGPHPTSAEHSPLQTTPAGFSCHAHVCQRKR